MDLHARAWRQLAAVGHPADLMLDTIRPPREFFVRRSFARGSRVGSPRAKPQAFFIHVNAAIANGSPCNFLRFGPLIECYMLIPVAIVSRSLGIARAIS